MDFAQAKPLPKPTSGESQQQFVSRCMANPTMLEEHPDEDERAGVCYSLWEQRDAKMKKITTVREAKGMCDGPCGFPMKEQAARLLGPVLKELPSDCRDYLDKHGARDPRTGAKLLVCRVTKAVERFEVFLDERDEISWVTTDAADRDREALFPEGGDWSQAQAAGLPITFAHLYDTLLLGNGKWIAKRRGERENGTKLLGWAARSHYIERPPPELFPQGNAWFADVVWYYVGIAKSIRGKSIGFLPLEMREPTGDDVTKRPWLEEIRLVFPKWLGLEWAVAPVQSNPDALLMEAAKAKTAGVVTPPEFWDALGIVVPTALPGFGEGDGDDPPEPPEPVLTRREVRERVQTRFAAVPQIVKDCLDRRRGRV